MAVVQTDVEAAAAAICTSYPSRVAALQRRFLEGLPARWSAISLASRGSEAQRADLHRLAGAAGSFGAAALGDAARAAECCIDADMALALLKLQSLLSNISNID